MQSLTCMCQTEGPQSQIRGCVWDTAQAVFNGMNGLMYKYFPKIKLEGTKKKKRWKRQNYKNSFSKFYFDWLAQSSTVHHSTTELTTPHKMLGSNRNGKLGELTSRHSTRWLFLSTVSRLNSNLECQLLWREENPRIWRKNPWRMRTNNKLNPRVCQVQESHPSYRGEGKHSHHHAKMVLGPTWKGMG